MRILIADDDPDEAFAMKSALQRALADAEIQIVDDGTSLIARLDPRDGADDLAADDEDPRVILLDLEMPKMGGLDVLKHLKGTEELRHLPVIVFSGHKDRQMVDRAYHLGANAYFEKPERLADYQDVIDTVVGFWKRAA
ncbi:MAG: response regulator [Hyphomicrobiaceae bacterium]|nr:response regulator [Hyphomicrobiaceae bacterium]